MLSRYASKAQQSSCLRLPSASITGETIMLACFISFREHFCFPCAQRQAGRLEFLLMLESFMAQRAEAKASCRVAAAEWCPLSDLWCSFPSCLHRSSFSYYSRLLYGDEPVSRGFSSKVLGCESRWQKHDTFYIFRSHYRNNCSWWRATEYYVLPCKRCSQPLHTSCPPAWPSAALLQAV